MTAETRETLSAAEAYRLWAPTYETENGLTELDELAVRKLSPVRFTRLLDAACGTGRRVPVGRGSAVGIDLVFEMLTAGARRPAGLANADLLALPFPDESFDLVWCRLAVSHVEDVFALYAELARVTAPEGTLVVTDLHPDAVEAGYRRDFRGEDGVPRSVTHYVHELDAHKAVAPWAGLVLEAVEEPRVEAIRKHFEARGELERWERERGLRALLALQLRKGAP